MNRFLIVLMFAVSAGAQSSVHVVSGTVDLRTVTTRVATSPANSNDTTGASTAYADRASAASSAASGTGFTPNQNLAGCGVQYISGLSFTVGACRYMISGAVYTSAITNVTLAAADPSNPRIDVIAVDTSSTVVVVQGTPAATPAQPALTPGSQLLITFVTIGAGATTPSNVAATLLFDEGTGGPGEWNVTDIVGGFALSTSNPYHLTHDLEGTTLTGANFSLVKPSGTFDASTANYLVFYIRSKAAWTGTPPTGLILFWLNGGTLVGGFVTLTEGSFGFSSSVTSGYQQISIPMSYFGIPRGALADRVKFYNATNAAVGYYIDYVTLQSGLPSAVPVTSTMNFRGPWASTASYNQNDVVTSGGVSYAALTQSTNVAVTTTANWAALASLATTNQNYRTIGVTFDGGGSALAGPLTRCTQVNYAGTISEATVIADQSGDATVDVKTVVYGSYTGPGSASSITASAVPAISSAVKYQDATLTGWTTALAANTVICFALTSPATVTWVSANIRVTAN